MKKFSILFIVCLNLLSALSPAQPDNNRSITDIELSVAARERENGKLGKAIYYFMLKGHHNEYELITIRFRCEQYSSSTKDSSFRPEIWRSSTSDGTLTVSNFGNQLEVQEKSTDLDGPTKANFLFGYSQNTKAGIVNRLISFSGGWIMSIRPINEVHTIEFVPFLGTDAFVKLDCNTLWLPGIDTTK